MNGIVLLYSVASNVKTDTDRVPKRACIGVVLHVDDPFLMFNVIINVFHGNRLIKNL